MTENYITVRAAHDHMIGQRFVFNTPAEARGDHIEVVVQHKDEKFRIKRETLALAKSQGFEEVDTVIGEDTIPQKTPNDADYPSSLQKPFPTRPVAPTPEKLEAESNEKPEANAPEAAGALGTVGPVNEVKNEQQPDNTNSG